MSDQIKHECGIALIRLLKPLDYYQKKYGTALYGLNKLYLLMEKQHNRGQDGAGVATIKLNPDPGRRYISRVRSNKNQPIKDIFGQIHNYFEDVTPDQMKNAKWLKKNLPFTGELLLGHLRYGTHGRNSVEACHPMLRQNNWITRNLVMAGNFNMTNVDELFNKLVKLGQYPKEKSDTVTVLEKIGHFLDAEVENEFARYKSMGYKRAEITDKIIESLDIQNILRKSSKKFDGGYALAGMIGHGDAFVMRDPAGVRPACYYQDDEVLVVASERPAIQTAFDVKWDEVKEVKPGHALIIKKNGEITETQVRVPDTKLPCSFERIYFSRGTDRDIYIERKRLGEQLVADILKKVNYDFENTVFTYVPNTAKTAFLGMVEGLHKHLDDLKTEKIQKLIAKGDSQSLTNKKLSKIMSLRPRVEELVIKDAKLRTFITDDASRSELVSHVYDVTYGIIKNDKDTLVVIDDSIVRGTTLKQSIINMVSRLKPKRIIVVSSAPQIRYPDCYGIDMSKMKNFVAFRAMIELLEAKGKSKLVEKAYKKAKAQEKLGKEHVENVVQELYAEVTYEEVSNQIAKIITPADLPKDIKVDVMYQTVEGLHQACPDHKGDWYFTGNYPTKGGNKVCNKSFTLYVENSDARAY